MNRQILNSTCLPSLKRASVWNPSSVSSHLRRLPCMLSSSRSFSTPQANSDNTTFMYPKAQELFQRITSTLSKEDVLRLSDETGKILGRTMRPNEFYYRGFGGGGGKRAPEEASDVAAAPAKTTVDVKLVGFDEKMKIKVIKEIRAIGGLGLKEAKELVEGAPKTIQKGIKPEAAEELKKKLEEVGAVVEIA